MSTYNVGLKIWKNAYRATRISYYYMMTFLRNNSWVNGDDKLRSIGKTFHPIISVLIPIMIFVTLLIMWFYGFIDSILINRIGIVLNFLAGFLIAPEILGIDRLNRIEIDLVKIRRWAQNLLIRYKILVIGVLIFTLIISLILIIPSLWIVIMYGGEWLTIMISGVPNIRSYDTDSSLDRNLLEAWNYLHDVNQLILGSLLLPSLLLMLIAWLPTAVIINIVKEDQNLRNGLVYWGIVLFILGNFLQFMSTF